MHTPLPSWNAGPAKQAILDFIARVTGEGGPDYIAPIDRIALFDNDGTLWCEMPMPVQLYFAQDRLQALAAQHPEWREQEPFRTALAEGAVKAIAGGGMEAVEKLMAASHAGMTTEEFDDIVRAWLASARHPGTGRPYTQMVYQPMLELLDYLRQNGFKTFIVSGGGIDFMRAFAADVYGVPPEQVIGSSINTRYELRDGRPVLVREPALRFFDDKAAKPVAVQHYIGRAPVATFGNSDGDREMLEWTTMGQQGARLGLIVHHTDGEREYAYDRQRVVSGTLDKGLDEAPSRGWVLVDMKRDWNAVFPPQVAR
ncbi:MAG: HAD family hydrolase [Pseudoxanthomonas sp.]